MKSFPEWVAQKKKYDVKVSGRYKILNGMNNIMVNLLRSGKQNCEGDPAEYQDAWRTCR